jgi:vacuolar-type H+-ATPase subunit B/Vma2
LEEKAKAKEFEKKAKAKELEEKAKILEEKRLTDRDKQPCQNHTAFLPC